jgi:hypothetical protein
VQPRLADLDEFLHRGGRDIPFAHELCALTTLSSQLSRDFCLFVKAKVDSEKYEKFKAVVSSIAGLRAESDAQRVKQQFSEEIDRLRGEVLGALPESDRELALVHFGCHIPESYRRFYSHLLRKRKR